LLGGGIIESPLDISDGLTGDPPSAYNCSYLVD